VRGDSGYATKQRRIRQRLVDNFPARVVATNNANTTESVRVKMGAQLADVLASG